MNNGPWRQSFLSMDPGSQSGASVLAVILTSITHDLGQRGRDADRAGEIGPFEAMRIRRVEAGDAFDRRLEVIEAAFLHQRGEFGAEARGARRFVDDQAAAGFLPRRLDRLDIERHQGAKINDFAVDSHLLDARLGEQLGKAAWREWVG